MLGYLSTDIICSRRRGSEQIMSKDKKYPSTFSCQMEAVVFIILQIFFCNTCSFENWGMFSDIPQFSWGICGHMTHLDQSHIHEQKLKCSYTVMARPMKTLELHLTNDLVFSNIIDLMFLEQ